MGWKSFGQQKRAFGSGDALNHDAPMLLKLGGYGAGPGAEWECRCGKTHVANLVEGKLCWDLYSDMSLRPDRAEVVERMMIALPAEGAMRPDYPGDAVVRSAFLVALHALERLDLAGDWRRE